MTPYDIYRGRITFRRKPEGARTGPSPPRPQYRQR
jgi:hypothetical protein